jgi:hypothetical protein
MRRRGRSGRTWRQADIAGVPGYSYATAALKAIDSVDNKPSIIFRRNPTIFNAGQTARHGHKQHHFARECSKSQPPSPGACAWIASACTVPASSPANVAFIMRWRSIRLFPRKACDTIYTLKCVSPPGLWPAWPSCRCDSSLTSRLSGRKASRNLFVIMSRVAMAAALGSKAGFRQCRGRECRYSQCQDLKRFA